MLATEPQTFLARYRWWLALAISLLVAALWYLYTQQPQSLAVVSVSAGPTERVLAITGRTRPRVTVRIVPKVAGELIELTKQEGERVQAGELLARLDAPALQASLDQAAAALAAQRSRLAETERTLARQTELRTRGLTTLKEFDAATFEREQAAAELRRLTAGRREAAAKLSDSSIDAPVSGVVLARPVDPGQVVTSQSVIYELAPLTDIEIETEVDERYLPEIVPGLKADVLIAGRGQPLTATVYYSASKVDPRSGFATVRLKLDATGPDMPLSLRSGVTADVNIIVERLNHAVTIPRSAMLGREQQARVLIVSAGVVAEQRVQFVEWPSDRVIVTAGLSAGDVVLAQPRVDLIGQRVRPVAASASDNVRDRSGGIRTP